MDEPDKQKREEPSTIEQKLHEVENTLPPSKESDYQSSNAYTSAEHGPVAQATDFMKTEQHSPEEVDEGSSRKRMVLICLGILFIGLGAAYGAFASGLISLPRAEAPAAHHSPSAESKKPLTPNPATKTYTSAVNGASFQYPQTWDAMVSKEGAESVTLAPSTKTAGSEDGLFTLSYIRHPAGIEDGVSTLPESSYSIADVSYETLPGSAANLPLYVQKTIVKQSNLDPQKPARYLTNIGLTATNTAKVGDSVKSPGTATKAFFVNGEKDSLTFIGTMNIKDTDGRLGTLTLEASQDFVKNNAIYKQARGILLSFKAPASN